MLNNIIANLTLANQHSLSHALSNIPDTISKEDNGQVGLFRDLVDDMNVVIHQTKGIVPTQTTDVKGDSHLRSMMLKLDHWRNEGNSYLANIQQSLDTEPLNAIAMMKLQLDLLKFSLGYEVTSKLVGKGVGAIDTLLRSQ